ncbi:hypothetical protein WN943_023385 [Citrus x changshan-huyou]
MWGEWNGLQALILKDCPYVYYIHCLAHRLQLALVVVSHEIVLIHHCFTKLTSVVNIVGASCKRNDELKCAQAIDIEYMISIDELENGRGLNQIGTLQRHGGTRWSSYFRSVSNLIKMFSATCFVLLNIIDDDTNAFQRGDANAAYELLILSSALDPRECRESFRIGDFNIQSSNACRPFLTRANGCAGGGGWLGPVRNESAGEKGLAACGKAKCSIWHKQVPLEFQRLPRSCQAKGFYHKVPFISDDLELEYKGKDKYNYGSSVLWKW